MIVQNFRAHTHPACQGSEEPSGDEVAWTVAAARLLLPEDVALQAPPNLNPASLEDLLRAGLNDLGGISPVTPDYINPGWAWPHLGDLAARCSRAGFTLQARLPVYPRHESRTRVDLAPARARCDAFRPAP